MPPLRRLVLLLVKIIRHTHAKNRLSFAAHDRICGLLGAKQRIGNPLETSALRLHDNSVLKNDLLIAAQMDCARNNPRAILPVYTNHLGAGIESRLQTLGRILRRPTET